MSTLTNIPKQSIETPNCINIFPDLEVKLEQDTALPSDSYIQPYFSDLKSHLSVGPPLIVVVDASEAEEFDLSAEEVQDKLCGGSGCDQDSLQVRFNSLLSLVNFTCLVSTKKARLPAD